MKNEDTIKTVGDYVGLLRRRRIYPVTIIPAGVMIALFIAYALPASYRGSTTIMQEGSMLPSKLVPTTVTGSPDEVQNATEQLELARRRVMTKESLIDLVKRVDPYPEVKESPADKAAQLEKDTEVERVDPITLEPSETSTAFTINYLNPDRKMAISITEELLQLYLSYNKRSRAEAAADALRFLEAQAEQLEGSMREMEQQLEQFKSKYGSALPDEQNRNLMGTDRAQRDLESFESQIRIAQEKEAQLSLQLSALSPSLTTAVSDWREELAKLRAELALDEQKYTPEHPDVKRLRRAIADLAAQGAASTKSGAETPDNPEYLLVKSQLDGTRRELAALNTNASRARGDLARYQSNLSQAPGVERQYIQLTRDYTIAQQRYGDLQNKIKEAALAQNLESEARGERLTLLRAPSASTTPASPNRLGIILLGVVLSLGIAFLAAVLKDTADPTVRGTDDLESIMGSSPVGHVPLILNRFDQRQRRLRVGLVSAVYVVAAIVVGATIFMAA